MAHIWSGVEESNLYSHFRRMLSYPLNERQLTLLYYLLVLKSRIELEIQSYQDCVMPFNYKSKEKPWTSQGLEIGVGVCTVHPTKLITTCNDHSLQS